MLSEFGTKWHVTFVPVPPCRTANTSTYEESLFFVTL